MSPDTYNAIVESTVNATEAMLVRTGAVGPPTLFVLQGDRLVGMVTMRPARRGADGAAAVGEMSSLAAAAQATDVVVTWEQNDLHVLCGGEAVPGPLALQVCSATRNGHTLVTIPFRVEVTTRRRRSSVRPIWGMPVRGESADRVPPVIETMLAYCWKPFDVRGVDVSSAEAVAAAAGWLRNAKHQVDLTR